MKKFLKFLTDYANGDDADVEFFITWQAFVTFWLIVGLLIYILWKW